jgi:hypothetical protein
MKLDLEVYFGTSGGNTALEQGNKRCIAHFCQQIVARERLPGYLSRFI